MIPGSKIKRRMIFLFIGKSMLGPVVGIATACLLTYVMVFVGAATTTSEQPKYVGPTLEEEEYTSCKEFSRYARFNPYSVMDDIWVVFYFFNTNVNRQIYRFYAPTSRRKNIIKNILNDSVTKFPVNWTNPVFIMKNLLRNASSLIMQRDDRGRFLQYPIVKNLKPGQLIRPHEIYFKQSAGGKYLSFMLCENHDAFVMARPHDIPRKALIQDEVAKVGFLGYGGRSYLYQGHNWMPIPEADDRDFPPEMFYMIPT